MFPIFEEKYNCYKANFGSSDKNVIRNILEKLQYQ